MSLNYWEKLAVTHTPKPYKPNPNYIPWYLSSGSQTPGLKHAVCGEFVAICCQAITTPLGGPWDVVNIDNSDYKPTYN